MASSFKWPIIINEHLRQKPLFNILSRRNDVKIRFSSSTLNGTCILPKCSVAFMFLTNVDMKDQRNCTERISRFVQMHRKAFVLIVTQPFDGKCIEVMSEIQLRLLTLTYTLMFTEDWEKAVVIMMNTAMAHSSNALSTVEETLISLFQQASSENAVLNVLGHLGLSKHESTLLLDGCGSISNLASASVEQLVEFGLDDVTIHRLREFFHKDTYIS